MVVAIPTTPTVSTRPSVPFVIIPTTIIIIIVVVVTSAAFFLSKSTVDMTWIQIVDFIPFTYIEIVNV